MRIGVLGCFYGCAEALPQVLAPWLSLKEKGDDIRIAAVHSQFKEYAAMGLSDADEATRRVLESFGPRLDFYEHSATPLSEHEARNIPLHFLLGENVDVVWMLDGDEFYTTADILA